MRTAPTILLVMFLAIAPLAHGQDDSPAEKPEATLLREIREEIAGRELPTAAEKLKAAKAIEGNQAFVDEVERLDLLLEYCRQFWVAVERGATSLIATEQIEIGDKVAGVVEYANGQLVLRVEGQNLRYTHKTVPAKVALTLAEAAMKKDDPVNKMIIGSFLLMDAKGKRELAAQYFREAQAGGVADVKFLLPELELAPAQPIEIPDLTPAMRRLLAPASWVVLSVDGKRLKREPLKSAGKQNELGRLDVTLPEDAPSPTAVVFSRRVNADFVVRCVLQDVKKGEKFGLFSATNPNEKFTVDLPNGSVQVEMARQAGKFRCLVNGLEQEVALPPDANIRAAGIIGVEAAAGQSFTVAWFELVGR